MNFLVPAFLFPQVETSEVSRTSEVCIHGSGSYRCAGALPRKVLREIFSLARRDFRAEFLTLKDLVRLVDAGKVAVAPAVAAPPGRAVQ